MRPCFRRCRRPICTALTFAAAAFTAPALAIDITVDLFGDPPPDGCTMGHCSLREAVSLANQLPGLDRILLPATPGSALQLVRAGADEDGNASGDLDVTDDLEIVGAGPGQTVLLQTAMDRLFDVRMTGAHRLTLRGLSLHGGTALQGGGIRSTAQLHIEDAELTGHHARGSGGAIHLGAFHLPQLTDVRLLLRRVRLADNVAERSQPSAFATGGAIHLVSGSDQQPVLLVEDCVFEDNEAADAGGAVFLDGSANAFGGPVRVRDTVFSGNRGGGRGGAIATSTFSAFAFVASDVVFDDNEAINYADSPGGGAIGWSGGGSLWVERSSFTSNFGRAGGAISSSAPTRISDSLFCGNSAAVSGGAFRGSREATVEGSTFCDNSVLTGDSTHAGGGGIAFAGASLTVMRSTFSGNTAMRGGSITHSSGDLSLRSNTVIAAAISPPGAISTALRVLETDPAAQLDLRNNLLNGTCSFAVGVEFETSYANVESPGHGCRLDTAALAFGNQLDVATPALHLGPLSDNGGPTPTHLPAAPSVLLDAGRTANCSMLDQRGLARVDASCDVGAVEAGAIAPDPRIHADGFENP